MFTDLGSSRALTQRVGGAAAQQIVEIRDAAEQGTVLATQVVRDVTAGKGFRWISRSRIEAKDIRRTVGPWTLDGG
jgi:hypothetical protein